MYGNKKKFDWVSIRLTLGKYQRFLGVRMYHVFVFEKHINKKKGGLPDRSHVSRLGHHSIYGMGASSSARPNSAPSSVSNTSSK